MWALVTWQMWALITWKNVSTDDMAEAWALMKWLNVSTYNMANVSTDNMAKRVTQFVSQNFVCVKQLKYYYSLSNTLLHIKWHYRFVHYSKSSQWQSCFSIIQWCQNIITCVSLISFIKGLHRSLDYSTFPSVWKKMFIEYIRRLTEQI